MVVINCALGANKVRADGGSLVSIAWFELVGLLRLVVVCVSLHVRAHQPSGSLQLRRHHVRQSTAVGCREAPGGHQGILHDIVGFFLHTSRAGGAKKIPPISRECLHVMAGF